MIAAKIDTHEFFWARFQNLTLRRRMVETLQFGNVDDAVFRLMGARSRPFTLATRSDSDTESNAYTLMDTYADLIEDGIKPFEYSSIQWDDKNLQVKVLDLQFGFADFPPVRPEKGAGFLIDGSRWIVSAQWQLMFLPKPPPPP